MSARIRENGLWLALGALASATMAWLGLYGFAWNDYELEALPAVSALVHGHLSLFFAAAPMYGGSLLERAPFALVPGLWGGGELAVYRMMALPCLLVAAGLGVWLAARIRAQGTGRLAAGVALGLCVANPLTLAALELGHPDELLGAALCVIAVLLAARGRAAWAGLALGLAVVNKQWAVLAAGPVLLALPAKRLLCASLACAVAGALFAPFALFGTSAFVSGLHGAADPGSKIFQPWQWWWFIGHHGPVVKGLFGNLKHGYRTAPAWIGTVSHPLIVGLGLPVTAAAWLALRGRAQRESAALLLLALLLLLRCALDTWDLVYYPLPCVLALGAWETLSLRRVPVLALGSMVAVWAGYRWLPSFASADAQAAFFAAWSIPLAIALAVRLFDGLQPLGKLREHLVPVAAQHRQVLDAHAEAS